jgi:cell division protein FtsN
MVWRGDRHVDAERDELSVEQEDFHADDEHEDSGAGSIFAAGWFRAVLVLTVLAVLVVAALPYLLDWFEPSTSPVKAPAPARQGLRSMSAPAPLGPPRAAQPRREPEPSLSAATVRPTSAKPITPAAPMLPPSAPASERVSRPLEVVKAATDTPTVERPRAVSTKPSDTSSEASGTHWVQLGIFKDLSNAERLARTLRDQGFPVQVASVTRSPRDATAGGTYHLVRAGAFADETRAAAARDDLKSRGYIGFLTEGAAK